MKNQDFYILVKGSGDAGFGDRADAVIKCVYEDGKIKEQIFTDEDGLLDILSSEQSYMSYLSPQDVADYIRKDGGNRFFSVKVISETIAYKVKEDPYNWE